MARDREGCKHQTGLNVKYWLYRETHRQQRSPDITLNANNERFQETE